MRNITLNDAFVTRTKSRNAASENQSRGGAAIALAVGGGLLFLLLGFFLSVIFTVSGGSNQLLNRAGIGSIIVAFIFFGLVAHFMDKSDENKRLHKRERIEKFNRT